MQQCSHRKFRTGCELLASVLLLVSAAMGGPVFDTPPVLLTLSAQSNGAQIQTALDALPPHGEVLLKAGTYEISQPLFLRHDDETLCGSGPATGLHLANGANCPVVILGPPITGPAHRATHLSLLNLMIDGNRKNQKTEHWRRAGDGSEINNDGVQIWDVNDAMVQNVVCCRCRSGGLVTAEVCHLEVDDFDAYDNQYDGLACYETVESCFNRLRLHDNLAAGISLDLDFDHNCISNAVLSSNDLGVFMRDSRSNSFEGLTITKSHHDGVFMAQHVAHSAKGWRLCPHTECVGNCFQTILVNDCGGRAFEVNDASCIKNVILGARFLHNLLGGLCQPNSHPVSIQQMAGR
jgi:hypothetical protein